MKLPEEYRQIGNLAIAKIDVKGLPQRMEAFSSFQKGEHGFISLPETKIFKPISVDKYHNIASPPRGTLRNIDGEYKLLETIAQQLGNNRNVSGRIDLFTELKACQSCSNERGKDNFFIAEMKKCYQQTNLDRIKSIYSSSDYHIFAKDVNKIQQTFKLNLANIMQQE